MRQTRLAGTPVASRLSGGINLGNSAEGEHDAVVLEVSVERLEGGVRHIQMIALCLALTYASGMQYQTCLPLMSFKM